MLVYLVTNSKTMGFGTNRIQSNPSRRSGKTLSDSGLNDFGKVISISVGIAFYKEMRFTCSFLTKKMSTSAPIDSINKLTELLKNAKEKVVNLKLTSVNTKIKLNEINKQLNKVSSFNDKIITSISKKSSDLTEKKIVLRNLQPKPDSGTYQLCNMDESSMNKLIKFYDDAIYAIDQITTEEAIKLTEDVTKFSNMFDYCQNQTDFYISLTAIRASELKTISNLANELNDLLTSISNEIKLIEDEALRLRLKESCEVAEVDVSVKT
jgi:hypothetical protein